MANTLKPKRSTVANKVPTTADLVSGEIGVNMTDQKVYINNGTSVVQVGAGKLTGLGDVSVSSPSSGQALTWNGTNWVNSTVSASASLAIQDEGSTLTSTPTSINFTGSGVTATNSGNAVTVSIGGGMDPIAAALVFGGGGDAGAADGVSSFNTRTGDVTLTSSDVTTALGYSPANKAGDTFSGGVNFNVGGGVATSSFAFSATNGTYYISAQARMSAGSYNPIVQTDDSTLIFTNGTQGNGALVIAPWSASSAGLRMTAAGATTLTGTLNVTSTLSQGGNAVLTTASTYGGTLTSSQVTTALGYTPLNPTTSQTANTVYAAPNGTAGAPTFRALVATDIPALSYAPTAGSTSITTLGTIGTGTWQGSIINSTYGGTGVNNAGRTLTINTNSGTLTFTNPTTTLTIANTASVSGTNTGDQTITLTGDVTGAGTGSFATTLATVNANTGTFGSATVVPVITVNAKGLITAVSTATITGGSSGITIADDTTTAATRYLTFTSATTGTITTENVSSTKLTFNPSTGVLTASGGFAGTATSAGSVTNSVTFNNSGTGAASGSTFNGSAAVTVSYNTIGASPLAGSTSLTTLGTVTAGTWNATAIAANYGGTGQTTYTVGDLLYASGTAALSKLAGNITTAKQFLTSTGTGTVANAPTWGALASSDVTTALGYTPLNPTTSQTANFVYAAPNGAAGAPTFRALVAADIPALSYAPTAGSASITTLGTVTTGTWNATVISPTYGGTGVNNGTRTLTISGTNNATLSFTTAATTLTVANTASVSGTNTGDQTITLTGDVTGTGTGSFATTLATVNANTGSFGSATVVPVITVNAKGLVTAVSTATISASGGLTISNDTTTATAVYPTLTSATTGTITAESVSSTKLSFVPSTGILSATGFAGSGASLTSLTAGNLSGTIPSAVLGNSSLFVGTTSIALNRASASQSLTGVSIDGTAANVTGTVAVANGGTGSTTAAGALTNLGAAPSASPTFSGTIDFSSGSVRQNVIAMAALDVNCSLGNYFTKTISANSTFTFSNAPSTRAYSFTLELTHTSGTVTWPTSVAWPSGITAPTLTTGKTHIFIFVTDDGGTRWRGAYLVDYTN